MPEKKEKQLESVESVWWYYCRIWLHKVFFSFLCCELFLVDFTCVYSRALQVV